MRLRVLQMLTVLPTQTRGSLNYTSSRPCRVMISVAQLEALNQEEHIVANIDPSTLMHE